MTTKQCFPCTACCEGWLSADINGVRMSPGTPCIHAQKQGCGIYAKRPKTPCITFSCGWLQEQYKLPEHMKPSECGAIVLFDRDYHEKKVIRAVPTGNKIPTDTLEWLKALAIELSLPLLFIEFLLENGTYIGAKKTGYGPPSFIRSVETEIDTDDIIMY